ncbi:S-layer homology domain-containing protein [Paenibacillus sp. JTLBN-2024]
MLHNRMEWKWFICFVCAAVIVSSFAFAGRAAAASSDVKGHWAEQLLAGWQDQGLLKGYPDGSMKPDRALTRIELMAMINRYFHLTAEKAASFPDLKSGSGSMRKPQKLWRRVMSPVTPTVPSARISRLHGKRRP